MTKKNIILIIMLLVISVFAVGCTKSLEDKLASKIGDKVLEKALGDDVNIDTDTKSNNVSLEFSDGSSQVVGENLEWPADKMNPLPEPEGKIISIVELKEHNSISVNVELNNHELAKDYLQKVKDLGYIESFSDYSGDTILFNGNKEDNTSVSVNYMFETLMISMIRDSVAAKKFFENE